MTYLNLQQWPRRAHYELYRTLAQPHFSLCVPVEITALVPLIKAQGIPLFTALLYAVTRAANEVPEFRYRLRPAGVVEHSVVHPSFTVLGENDLFGFCTVAYTPAFLRFAEAVAAGIAAARTAPSLADEPGRDDLLFITSLPWLAFTSMTHPVAGADDSFPRIAWGKYTAEQGRYTLPVAVQVHHALVDGLHVAHFFTALQTLFATPAAFLRAED